MPANEANGKNSLPGSTTANKIVTGINSNDTTNVAGCPITKAGLIPIFKPTAPLNFLAISSRVASTGIVRGAASFCLDWAYAQTQNLRMDTYSDNIPMQKLLEKCGFQYCGSFERLGMDKWMAYQKI